MGQSADQLMVEYHDREWGVPVHEDRKHFEFLVLEGGPGRAQLGDCPQEGGGVSPCFQRLRSGASGSITRRNGSKH